MVGAPEAAFLDTAILNLKEIVQPIGPAPGADQDAVLTPREREIANLVRAGKSTAEIARALYISADTVAFHRKNLRRKLGLGGRGTRLASHLSRASPNEVDEIK
jgi:DNA-binding CsgD family transcriptional regulator